MWQCFGVTQERENEGGEERRGEGRRGEGEGNMWVSDHVVQGMPPHSRRRECQDVSLFGALLSKMVNGKG